MSFWMFFRYLNLKYKHRSNSTLCSHKEISALLPWPQSPWGAHLWFQLFLWMNFLVGVGVVICTLLGQWHIFWHPLADFLVASFLYSGQQGRFWHLPMDCQVARAIHILQEQQGSSTQNQISVMKDFYSFPGQQDRFGAHWWISQQQEQGRSWPPLEDFPVGSYLCPSRTKTQFSAPTDSFPSLGSFLHLPRTAGWVPASIS